MAEIACFMCYKNLLSRAPESKLVALSGVTKIRGGAGQESEAKGDAWGVANSGSSEKEESILVRKNKRISGNSYAASSETASAYPLW